MHTLYNIHIKFYVFLFFTVDCGEDGKSKLGSNPLQDILPFGSNWFNLRQNTPFLIRILSGGFR